MPNPRWRENRPAQSWISNRQPACNRRMTPVLIVRAWPARLAPIGRQADDSAAWPKCASRRLAICSTQCRLYVMAVALNLHSISAVGRGGHRIILGGKRMHMDLALPGVFERPQYGGHGRGGSKTIAGPDKDYTLPFRCLGERVSHGIHNWIDIVVAAYRLQTGKDPLRMSYKCLSNNSAQRRKRLIPFSGESSQLTARLTVHRSAWR